MEDNLQEMLIIFNRDLHIINELTYDESITFDELKEHLRHIFNEGQKLIDNKIERKRQVENLKLLSSAFASCKVKNQKKP